MSKLKKNSVVDFLRKLDPEDRKTAIEDVLTPAEAKAIKYSWYEQWARPEQFPPEDHWTTWLIMTGRGWGKNRTASELIRERVVSGKSRKLLLISKNPTDAREDMIEDEYSGLLEVHPPEDEPVWEPGNKRLLWDNGAVAHIRTGAKPENIRGGGYDFVWMDELASWDYPRRTYEQVQFTLRRGSPKQVITTTPKPIQVLIELRKDIKEDPSLKITEGTTWENKTNLSDDFLNKIIKRYRSTRLGKQELEGKLLTSAPGALWSDKIIHVKPDDEIPDNLEKVAVGVDPATTNNTDSDETGIIVSGKAGDKFYILDNGSDKYSPDEWASKAVTLYDKWEADRIIAERNQGGDMVESNIQTVADVPVDDVHATRGKQTRAEPIASLYEQSRVFHRADPEDLHLFEKLEDQLKTWTPGDPSPDQLDALVWSMKWLKDSKRKFRGGSPQV